MYCDKLRIHKLLSTLGHGPHTQLCVTMFSRFRIPLMWVVLPTGGGGGGGASSQPVNVCMDLRVKANRQTETAVAVGNFRHGLGQPRHHGGCVGCIRHTHTYVEAREAIRYLHIDLLGMGMRKVFTKKKTQKRLMISPAKHVHTYDNKMVGSSTPHIGTCYNGGILEKHGAIARRWPVRASTETIMKC